MPPSWPGSSTNSPASPAAARGPAPGSCRSVTPRQRNGEGLSPRGTGVSTPTRTGGLTDYGTSFDAIDENPGTYVPPLPGVETDDGLWRPMGRAKSGQSRCTGSANRPSRSPLGRSQVKTRRAPGSPSIYASAPSQVPGRLPRPPSAGTRSACGPTGALPPPTAPGRCRPSEAALHSGHPGNPLAGGALAGGSGAPARPGRLREVPGKDALRRLRSVLGRVPPACSGGAPRV